MLERSQEVLIHGLCLFITRAALAELRLESLSLIIRIVELRKCVRHFSAGDKQLESIDELWPPLAAAGEW